jgi:hypothetical protein
LEWPGVKGKGEMENYVLKVLELNVWLVDENLEESYVICNNIHWIINPENGQHVEQGREARGGQ